jgi:hypothetical protein
VKKKGFLSRVLFGNKKDDQPTLSWQSLSHDLDALCHSVVFSLKIDSGNLQHVLVASLYLKILRTFQGVAVLAEKEMLHESKTLLRGMLESVFAAVAISKDPSLAKRFVEDDYVQRLKLLRAFNDLPERLKKTVKPRMSKIIKSRLHGLINAPSKPQDISPLSAEYLAKRAGMEDIYYSVFALLTGSNYLRVYELEHYWEKHGHRDSLKLLCHPDAKQIDTIMYTAVRAVFLTVSSVSHTFNIEIPNQYTRLINQFRQLSGTPDKLKAKKQTQPAATETFRQGARAVT